MTIRGERRSKTRATKNRRAATRTPGKMKTILDTVHELDRKKKAAPSPINPGKASNRAPSDEMRCG